MKKKYFTFRLCINNTNNKMQENICLRRLISDINTLHLYRSIDKLIKWIVGMLKYFDYDIRNCLNFSH
jgi:hypothetical protein